MSKYFVIIIVCMSLFLISCNKDSSNADRAQKQKVVLLSWPGGPEYDALQEVVNNYNSQDGVSNNSEVEILSFSRQGFFDKLKADLAAESKDFDLNLVTTYSLGTFVPYLEPLDNYIGGDDTSNFIKSALNSLSYNGNQYGIPSDVSLHLLFYRKDLIDQLAENTKWQEQYANIAKQYLGQELNPKDPAEWTWDDYIATVLFFTQSINPESPTKYGTVLQLKNLLFNIMIWQDTMVSYGGNWQDESGTITINSPEAKRGLEIYQKIIENGATPPSSINYEFAEANEAFKASQAAVMTQWNAAYSVLADKEESPVFDKLGVTHLPAGSKGHVTHIHSLGFGMNKNSEHKDAASKFLKFFATIDAMSTYAEGGTPPVASVLKDLGDVNQSLPVVASALSNGYIIRGGTSDNALAIYTLQAEEFSAVWAGIQSIPKALANVENRMADLIH